MRKLERRLQRDLDRIADRAPVPTGAWERLRLRLDDEPERRDEEIIMLAPAEPTSRRPRRTAAIAVALTGVVALVLVGIVALLADDDATPTIDEPPATTAAPEPAPAAEVEWRAGPSFPGRLRDVTTWSGGLAAIMDPDGDETPGGGEVWYSTDGIEWAPESATEPGDDVFVLAGQHGALFALAGDPDDPATAQTLWHRTADDGWVEVVTSDALDLMAVGPAQVVAYRGLGFEIVGVFDTVTMAPIEVTQPPAIEPTEAASGQAFEPIVESGRAIALDEGFLADVHWITGADDGDLARESRLMYSADGSVWTEHPDPPDGTVAWRDPATAPVHGGLNLLSLPNRVDTEPYLTDDGLSFAAATDPGVGGPTGTEDGFFSVDSTNGIHRSLDGVTWDELPAPPTWPKPALVAADDGEVQFGSIISHGDLLLAIGIRGDFEGFVGITDPTTEIWVADARSSIRLGDQATG